MSCDRCYIGFRTKYKHLCGPMPDEPLQSTERRLSLAVLQATQVGSTSGGLPSLEHTKVGLCARVKTDRNNGKQQYSSTSVLFFPVAETNMALDLYFNWTPSTPPFVILKSNKNFFQIEIHQSIEEHQEQQDVKQIQPLIPP
jgi:hypothetical protein